MILIGGPRVDRSWRTLGLTPKVNAAPRGQGEQVMAGRGVTPAASERSRPARLRSIIGRVLGPLALAWMVAGAAPSLAVEPIRATLTVSADKPLAEINRNLYGQFVEHLGRGVYEGIWVGDRSSIPNTHGIRNDVVAALRKLNVPNVRWPGGCFADDYHWRDGVGPRASRPHGINGSWGSIPESNAFGTHEFMDFVEQIGAQPYIGVNVGSGSPAEAEAWMQYMTAKPDTPPGQARARNGHEQPWAVPLLGVGNESWGCGGNMYPDTYADQFRQFAAYLRNYSGERPMLIAGGADTDDYDWTQVVMSRAMKWRRGTPSPLLYDVKRPLMDGLSLHFYTLPTGQWDKKGPATGFGEDAWISTLARALLMDELIRKHGAIMDRYDPDKTVALVVDEWGTWFDGDPKQPSGLYQDNTLRDAMVAAVTLNIFHAHADRVRMANIAQMVNVLQAMILTEKDRMILTPTYHVFEMYKVHQGAMDLPVAVSAPAYRRGAIEVPSVTASASRDAAGKVHLSLVNLDPNRPAELAVAIPGFAVRRLSGRILTGQTMDARNSFDAPHVVEPAIFNGARLQAGRVVVNLPEKSIVVLELE